MAWATSDLGVATINRDGLLTAMGNGFATISASTHTVTTSTRVEVDQVPVILNVVSTTDLLAIGDSVRMTAQAFDAGGSPIVDADFTWTSSDTGVATVNRQGWVYAVAEGVAEITATLNGLSASATLVTASPDEIALLAFFRSAHGPSWNESANWATDAPLAEWQGVEVDETAKEIGELESLQSLFLYGNRLTGSIPPELGKLAALDSLLLGPGWSSGANTLTGPIPPELGNLVRLLKLDLGHNDLSGTIPGEPGKLTRLVFLQLDYNQLTGKIPPELGKLTRLEWLVACSNELSGPIPPEFGELRALERMYLCSNDLGGPLPTEIGDLGNLLHMYLGANHLSGEFPESMLSLKHLTELFWRRNNGLCAPMTEEFEGLARGHSEVLRYLLRRRSEEGGTGGDRAAYPGSCSVTVVAAHSASGRSLRAPGVGTEGVPGARREFARGRASLGPPGTWAVSCERGR